MRHKTIYLIFFFALFSLAACADGGSDSNDELTDQECHILMEDCEGLAKVESWEHECALTEPETPGCLIEKEGLFNQTYFNCVKKKRIPEYHDGMLWQYNCLANCFYNKLECATYEQAEEECRDQCGFSTDL